MADTTSLHNPLIDSRAFGYRPGQNGRPPNYGSITYWYRRLLGENGGMAARLVAEAVIAKAKTASPIHVVELTERTDGKVASEVNFKGIMVHVGDDYAKAGLEAAKNELDQRQAHYNRIDSVTTPSNGAITDSVKLLCEPGE